MEEALEPGLYFGKDSFGNSMPNYLHGIVGGGKIITLGVPRDLAQQQQQHWKEENYKQLQAVASHGVE